MSKAACVQRAFVRRSAIIGTTLVLVILTAQPVLANPMSIGPQAMEGNVNVKPGDFIAAGYFLDVPGSHLAVTVQLANAQVAFVVSCVTGSGGGSIIIPLAPGPYNIPQNSDAVFPTNDQSSPASYQGSILAPDLCSGGAMSLRAGGTFSADLQASDTSVKVKVAFHYRAPAGKGKPNVDCAQGSFPADVCGASKSASKAFIPGLIGEGGGGEGDGGEGDGA